MAFNQQDITVAIDGDDEYTQALLSDLLKFRTYIMELYPPSASVFVLLNAYNNCF
ncbi:hypothetical protein MtrunA17_Chr8g0370061 [Medicago truncatula]|uniref:Uncharacterized protein n=1 Tax=Medicago truncatula TaxID=3880 RepID=A0A396GMR8_MEDTR|nr:hypothetical protein MtrunA17_Chr8g0370061 [Medicago truncatula]